ncbi:hypothetical protein ACFY00_31270 [Kitasatospora sp. NPDC001540]|uniref:hypothetical protein n=1 Tax=Kitasatospora sp. NPDC001540 TaxID=3364014 RepID=UPI003690A8D4
MQSSLPRTHGRDHPLRPRGTLERLRPEPGDLLPKGGSARITGFRLTLVKSVGSTRGNAETGFIRTVDSAVQRFHSSVVAHLDPPSRRARPAAASKSG